VELVGDLIFIILTPNGNYEFRAAHEVALLEWLRCFENIAPECLAPSALSKLNSRSQLNLEPDFSEFPRNKAYLLYSRNGESYKKFLTCYQTLIGRSSLEGSKYTDNGDMFLSMRDVYISREHAKIFYRNSEWVFVDLGSGKGSIINGLHVTSKVLEPGDVICLGKTIIYFEVAQAPTKLQILKEGYLEKLTRSLSRRYQKRWFILCSDRLYYKDKASDRLICGVIPLEDIQFKGDGKIDFELIIPSRTYQLRAPNDQQRNDWLQSFSIQSSLRS